MEKMLVEATAASSPIYLSSPLPLRTRSVKRELPAKPQFVLALYVTCKMSRVLESWEDRDRRMRYQAGTCTPSRSMAHIIVPSLAQGKDHSQHEESSNCRQFRPSMWQTLDNCVCSCSWRESEARKEKRKKESKNTIHAA